MYVAIIIKALVIGFVASMPVGAVAILTVQKTLNSGQISGFIIGLAAAIVDLIYASIAVLGLGMIKDFLFSHERTLAILGAIFLIISGIKIYKSDTIKQFRAKKKLTKMSMANDFFSSFLIAASNPVTIIGFGSFFATFGIHDILTNSLQTTLFLIFLFIGAITWWFTITFVINKFRKKIKLKILVIINRITGLVIVGFGILIILLLFIKK